MHPVFFLRHFNDVDHIAPIMWECVSAGDDITCVMLDLNYNTESDPRLRLLDEHPNFNLVGIDEFLNISFGRSLFELNGRKPERWFQCKLRRLLSRSRISVRRAESALTSLDPDACIFEWGPPYRTSHAEMFSAATRLDIPRLCLPHGLNIYVNEDITPGRKRAFQNNSNHMKSRNKYDAYVTQSEHDRDQEGKLGVDPDVHYVLGSARYYLKWQSINQELYESYSAEGKTEAKLRTVFMLPHWEYNVDKETTLQLISELIEQNWLYLVVKEHTRGDSLPQDIDNRLVKREDTAVEADTPSVSLIKWADAVINFGSSIGIEALLQDKHHVNPTYLHTNRTIFDETGAGHRPRSNKETISTLQAVHAGQAELTPKDSKQRLYETVIYGGRKEHDVLESYRDFISRFVER